jgi:transcriptional regulator with XRE-family HTH domain
MDASGLGGEFRALRIAAGRTVASVAVDAGLSVPYIANLENGRGNPTIGALSRLAAALGRRLVVGLSSEPAGGPGRQGESREGSDNSKKPAAAMSASLARFARTPRFRATAAAIVSAAGRDGAGRDRAGADAAVAARLMAGLAALAGALDIDPGEADWARLLDALFLVAAGPRGE